MVSIQAMNKIFRDSNSLTWKGYDDHMFFPKRNFRILATIRPYACARHAECCLIGRRRRLVGEAPKLHPRQTTPVQQEWVVTSASETSSK
jgi:hypothetical protein